MVNVVTNPGELDKVPIKVVPIYIEPVLEEYVDPEPEPTPPDVVAPVRTSPLLGGLALTVGVLMVVVHIAAIVVSSANQWVAGTVIGWVAIALSVLAVIGGVVAIVLARGRGLGLAAVVVGIVGNPFVLLVLLRVLSGAQS